MAELLLLVFSGNCETVMLGVLGAWQLLAVYARLAWCNLEMTGTLVQRTLVK